MSVVRFVLVLIAMVAVAKPADACIAGRPCNKNRQRVVVATPTQYTRQSGGTFRSFTRSRVVKFLTGATWAPAGAAKTALTKQVRVIPAKPLRFVEASHASRAVGANNQRVVLVRRIEYREGVTLIEVDNDRYALEPCAGNKRMCLSLRNDLDFEPVEDAAGAAPQPVDL